MSDNDNGDNNGKKIAEGKTTRGEWLVILLIIVITAILIVLVYTLLVPNLFQGSGTVAPGPPGRGAPTCPTSLPPENLTGIQNDFTAPTMDVTWDPVTQTTTEGANILGYNIYISENAGITESNKLLKSFTQVPFKRLTGLKTDTQYFFKVSTVDSCGNGAISTEEGTFTTAAPL